jgi:P pilus assembly chaperone PapD
MKLIFTPLLLAASALMAPAAHAFGVSVSPTAIMLDSRSLFGHVELTNTSERSKTFLVEFSGVEQESCFKVSPKMVSIPSGGTQMVRVQYNCAIDTLPASPMVFFTETPRTQNASLQQNQLDFRLRLGLKVKLQDNPIKSLF